MNGLEMIVLLGVAILVGTVLAPRIRLATPLLLLAIGLALGFVPAFRDIEMPPEAVLLVFLPVMLFWESLTTSVRAITRDLRGVLIRSTFLVVLSAFAAALVVSWFGVPWAAALVLGAALAPPDATAAAPLARDLPRRQFMILKAESLTNDGTALVVYGVAVGIAAGGQYTAWSITGIAAVSYLGGIAVGLAAAGLGYVVMTRLTDTIAINMALLLIPFCGYLAAELIGASGVLAVVVAGLVVTTVSERMSTAASRQMTESVWPLGSAILNGALFVLIGLEVQKVFHEADGVGFGRVAVLIGLVALVLVAVRFLGIQVSVWLIRAVDRRPSQKASRANLRTRIVTAFTGFRGAVSLAIALSVPLTTDDGSPFPYRDEIILVTAGVIVVLLVAQGPLLPALIRWGRAGEDAAQTPGLGVRDAQRELLRQARDSLDETAESVQAGTRARNRADREYSNRWRAVTETMEDPDDEGAEPVSHEPEYTRLMLALLKKERATLNTMRAQGAVDEEVYRRLRSTIDVEEIRISGVEPRD